MIIRNGDNIARVVSISSDSLKRKMKTYPALRFEFENEVKAEDIAVLLSGNFEIVDDNGNVIGTKQGYNTLKNISVTVGKITTSEQQIEDLEATVAFAEAANTQLTETNKTLTETLEIALIEKEELEATNESLITSLEIAHTENQKLQNAIDVVVGGVEPEQGGNV